MNNIARVIGSVVLLGACAVAMRFTMQGIRIPELQHSRTLEKQIDVSKAKSAVVVVATVGQANNLSVQSHEANSIKAEYSGTDVAKLHLADKTGQNPFVMGGFLTRKDQMGISYSGGWGTSQHFFNSKPRTYASSSLHLPRHFPLSLLVFSMENHNANYDLFDLEIEKFYANLVLENSFDFFVNLPQRLPKEFYIYNPKGRTRIRSGVPLQGKVTLSSDAGVIDYLDDADANKNRKFQIHGDAPNAQEFRQRIKCISKSAVGILWQEPNQSEMSREYGQWVLLGQTAQADSNALILEIFLGKSAVANLHC